MNAIKNDQDRVYAQVLNLWQQQVQIGRLPFYRNWQQPLVCEDVSLQGLSTVLLTQNTVTGALTRKSGTRPPVSWWTVPDLLHNFALVPVYEGGPCHVWPRPGLVDLDAVFWNTGYTVVSGPAGIEGQTIAVPDALDLEDRDVAALQLMIHARWHAEGHAGSLGAELAFVMIAAYFGLNLATVLPTLDLAAEIMGQKETGFHNVSLRAQTFVLNWLDGLGIGEGFREGMSFPEAEATKVNRIHPLGGGQ